MDHTYLRYECADAFGLTTAAASSKAPPSNSILAFLSSHPKAPLMTIAGSHILGINLRQLTPEFKLGHAELLTGGVGSGRALNSDEVVCLVVGGSKIATGWVDGGVRVFEMTDATNLVHSLLVENGSELPEPLVLNGHTTPVRSIAMDQGTRLASGGVDGAVVLWDLVAETGIFRLLGHRGAITDILFFAVTNFDGLITTSLDGLVKIWDLQGQCCTQTVASHRGEVWAGALAQLHAGSEKEEEKRWRLITGSIDGQIRLWNVQAPKRTLVPEMNEDTEDAANKDDVCHLMGTLNPPLNLTTSTEKVIALHFHPNGRYVGILHGNSRDVDVYMIRSSQEAQKKRQRRLRRRREKKSKPPVAETGRKRGILDDPESEGDEPETNEVEDLVDPDLLKASDEFEYYGTVRASHKIRGFTFTPYKEKDAGLPIVCALSTNALEVLTLRKKREGEDKDGVVISEKVSTLDMYGHPTGIRSIALSSDDSLACTVSKNSTKIWNVSSRTCLQSLSPSNPKRKGNTGCYGLCALFLPGNTHVALGTREGFLLILDVASGDVVFVDEAAHEGAIWSLDVRRPTPQQETIALVTGSADKTVKFWDIESQDDEDEQPGHPMAVHTRTLQMTDDVVAVRYSHSTDPTKRMIFISALDSTIKVFFDDTLKFFLSLYGHKLPALAVDASDDDTILASSGADKTIKIWGLDFGDTHRTLYGHSDSITDLKFVRNTHYFFTASKDGTVRYWDGDRFEQVLLLNGHCAEVNCLAISRTGAFVVSGGMDRQVRVWERTQDIVFLEEERERRLEQMFDTVESGRNEQNTANIMKRKGTVGLDDEDGVADDDQPQSEAAVKRSVLSVSAGDRIMEALEKADQELKDISAFKQSQGTNKQRSMNPFLLGLEPSQYILWVLRSVKSAELEQSLLVLPLGHMERLIYYLNSLLRAGRGIELCARVGVFMIKTHQKQVRRNNQSSSRRLCYDDHVLPVRSSLFDRMVIVDNHISEQNATPFSVSFNLLDAFLNTHSILCSHFFSWLQVDHWPPHYASFEGLFDSAFQNLGILLDSTLLHFVPSPRLLWTEKAPFSFRTNPMATSGPAWGSEVMSPRLWRNGTERDS